MPQNEAAGTGAKITAIAFAPNGSRLAVASADRIVYLFDAETGERRDKFATKPATDKVQGIYIFVASLKTHYTLLVCTGPQELSDHGHGLVTRLHPSSSGAIRWHRVRVQGRPEFVS
jgi:WD40 repeat protein